MSLQVRATLQLLLCSLTCCSGTGPSFGPSFVGTVAGWNCHLKKSLQSLQESCDVQGGNLSVTNPSVHCCCTCCFCFSFKNQEIRHHHQNIPCPRKAINIHKLHLPLHQTSSDLIRLYTFPNTFIFHPPRRIQLPFDQSDCLPMVFIRPPQLDCRILRHQACLQQTCRPHQLHTGFM